MFFGLPHVGVRPPPQTPQQTGPTATISTGDSKAHKHKETFHSVEKIHRRLLLSALPGGQCTGDFLRIIPQPSLSWAKSSRLACPDILLPVRINLESVWYAAGGTSNPSVIFQATRESLFPELGEKLGGTIIISLSRLQLAAD